MKGRKAHTFYDERYTEANKINNMKIVCPKGQIIKASQKKDNITISCQCGISTTTVIGGIIDASDALTDFHDEHIKN